MADTGIFCSGLHVTRKAGANVNSDAVAEAFTNDFISQAESEINVTCGFNFSDEYSGLNVDTKEILKEAASNLAAMYAIQYDMSGFTSRLEAQTMLDVLRDSYLRQVSLLRVKNKQDFINDS